MAKATSISGKLRGAVAALACLVAGPAFTAESCVWEKTPSGADRGTCVGGPGVAYCVSCSFSPRVCVRTKC